MQPGRSLSPLVIRIAVILAGLVGATFAQAEEESASRWPQWRGATGRGVSPATQLPTTWTATDGLAWRVELPGRSGATPVLWEDRLYVTSTAGPKWDALVLIAVGTDGKILWQKTVSPSGSLPQLPNQKNTVATPSPITDGGSVWVYGAAGDLVCYDKDGGEKWRRSITKDHGPVTNDFGLASTPVLANDRLYIQTIHRGADSYVLALDARTGRDVWKIARPTDARDESRDAYSSPTFFRSPAGPDQDQLIVTGGDIATAYRPSDGAEIWRSADLNRTNNPYYRFIVSPVATEDFVLITACKRGPMHAIKPDGQGDVTQTKRIWSFEGKTPDVATPAVTKNAVIMIQEVGVLTMLDRATGKVVWSERIGTGFFGASPLVADGKIFVASEQGNVWVVEESRTYKLLARNRMNEVIQSSPIAGPGRLYLRTEKALVAIGK